jgi:pimeloyl-ACP methyl ester carboxylesterase
MARLNRFALVLSALVFQAPVSRADDPPPKTFDSNGVKIRYYVDGKGESVVLIHGLYSSAKINWDLMGTTAMLAKDYQVITFDVRGHGASDKPADDKAYGTEMVEDVVRLLDHLKIKKAHVVGYSMGGMITAKLLTSHPDRVLSATLGGMGWVREGGIMQKAFGFLGAKEGGPVPAAAVRNLNKLAVTEDELKAIKVPVTVLVGDHDPCKKIYVAPLQEVRKDWPVVEITDAGHITCISKTQFKEEIQKWLAKQAKAAK